MMAHSLTSIKIHYIFSTKHRAKIISPEIRERLWSYMSGIAQNNGIEPICIGGTVDHVHLLLKIPAKIGISKAIQLIKAGSSKWVCETFPSFQDFSWQEGYAAFSIGGTGDEKVIAYILNQDKHHLKRTFEEEYLQFIRGHGIEPDERFLYG